MNKGFSKPGTEHNMLAPQYDGDDPQQIQLVNMIPKLRSEFKVAIETDTTIIIIDQDIGSSVTNDAHAVVSWLNHSLSGGIGQRRLYYLDTEQRFDELRIKNGVFDGFSPCTHGQQLSLHEMLLKLLHSVSLEIWCD